MTKEEAKEKIKNLVKDLLKDKILTKEEIVETVEECRGYFDLKETERAYIAGIVDGEGHIGLCRDEKIRLNGSKYMSYTLTIAIVNTYHDLVYWIKKKVGFGKISDHINNSSNRKIVKQIKIFTRDVEKFIVLILPYLLVKKEQAILALEFVRCATLLKGRGYFLTEKQLITREIIFEELAALNKKGGDHAST